ncbi:glycoside hydrolase family 128 protein [Peniophora sp. CONT]|nr:glycoside hydrolase family 128 protein [Peniophora sp. CONT]
MARLLSLLALSTLAVFVSASTGDHHRVARSFGKEHNLAKRNGEVVANSSRKRDVSKRCAAKSSSAAAVQHAAATSAVSASSSVAAATSTKAAATTSKAAETTTKKASATTSTSKAVATTASSSSSSGGCSGKAGLAWSNHEADLIPDFTNSNVCWIYDWEESLQYGMTTKGLHFIPMLWGYKNADAFKSKVVKGYAEYAAFLNEPDISSQSNIGATEAVSMWKTYMAPLKSQGYKLISAAPATGPKWLQDFRTACKNQGVDCSWDYTAGHIYTTSVDSFKTVATSYHSADFDWAPVMITEYACQDYSGKNQQASSDQIYSFMTSTKSWLDAQDFIAAYFYFAPMTASELESNQLNGANAFITSDGSSLTSLAKLYIS